MEIKALLRSLRGTSSRTFLVYPVVALVADVVIRRRLRLQPAGLPLMLLGYLQYRLCGSYLMKEGEGSGYGSFSWRLRQTSQAGNRAPAKLVTTGPYSVTRNPMYLGHMLCMVGLALTVRSPLTLALTIYHCWWLRGRALEDERSLAGRFAEDYASYRRSVPRWLPGFRFDNSTAGDEGLS